MNHPRIYEINTIHDSTTRDTMREAMAVALAGVNVDSNLNKPSIAVIDRKAVATGTLLSRFRITWRPGDTAPCMDTVELGGKITIIARGEIRIMRFARDMDRADGVESKPAESSRPPTDLADDLGEELENQNTRDVIEGLTLQLGDERKRADRAVARLQVYEYRLDKAMRAFEKLDTGLASILLTDRTERLLNKLHKRMSKLGAVIGSGKEKAPE